ncbi:MAG: hypothetical protein V1827_00710 [Candidatus Micrarchaeota archaeon]
MARSVYAALLGILLLSSNAFAQAGAWEIDYSKCDRGGVDTQSYCDGYCEYETYEECDYVSHIASDTPKMIDQCVCICGVDQEEVVYNDVPCLDDLTRYGTPSGDDDFGMGSCCLPAFLLLGIAAFAMKK